MNYPSVLRRYLSTLLDVLILWSWIYVVTRVPAIVESDWAVAAVVVPVILTYEPLLTAYRCTIGQWVFRLRVRKFGSKCRISIPSRSDRRAVHDFASETIVIEAAQDEP